MTKTFKQLIYISHAVGRIDRYGLERILQTARGFNAGRDVTGLLLFHEGSFLQILEGKKDDVDQVMARIKEDPRHAGIIVLQDKTVTARAFPDWSMGYCLYEDLLAPQQQGFLELKAFAATRGDYKPAQNVDVQIDMFLSLFRELAV